MILIDPNKRPNFSFAGLDIHRTVTIALPFITLHPQAAIFTSIGVGCCQGYSLWTQPSKEGKWKEAAWLVSSAAMSCFLPKYQPLLSSLRLVGQLIEDKTWQDRSKTVCRIVHQAIYFLSLYQKTPIWIALSLVSQALEELAQVRQHYKDRKIPEMIASFLLGAIRFNTAALYVDDFLHPNQISFRELLEGDQAFYNQPNYLETTRQELSQSELLPTTYRSRLERLFLVNTFVHILAGKFAILPASNPHAMGYPENYADISRQQIPLTDEWKYKRMTIQVDRHKIDVMIVGKASTLNNGSWVLASNGNGEFYEDKMSRSSDFKEILTEIKGNGIVFNYPGVGSSSGVPSRYMMAKAYRAVLSFLEDQKNGIGAKKIVGWGHSIGGGVQGDALKFHRLKEQIQYVFVKSRTFSNLSEIASILTNKYIGFLVKLIGWNIDPAGSSKQLKAPEIILQTTKVSSYELLKDSTKVINDGVIPAAASLAKTLLDDASCLKDNKLFVGIPEGHNSPLSNIPYLVKLINSFTTKKPAAFPN